MFGEPKLGPVGMLSKAGASAPAPAPEGGISREAVLSILQGGGSPEEMADQIMALVGGEEAGEPSPMA